MKSKELARLFHETYEKLAPDFNYKTRKASAKPWLDVPENNRKLMIAVATKILLIMKKRVADGCIEDCAIVDDNKYLREAVSMLNSMVLSGEEHSDESKKIIKQVLKG